MYANVCRVLCTGGQQQLESQPFNAAAQSLVHVLWPLQLQRTVALAHCSIAWQGGGWQPNDLGGSQELTQLPCKITYSATLNILLTTHLCQAGVGKDLSTRGAHGIGRNTAGALGRRRGTPGCRRCTFQEAWRRVLGMLYGRRLLHVGCRGW